MAYPNFKLKLFQLIALFPTNYQSNSGSKAKKVSLSISDYVNKIEMKYSDDGIGFDVLKIKKITEGVGLFNMQNRVKTLGGSFTIKSTVTEGTMVHVVLPIKD